MKPEGVPFWGVLFALLLGAVWWWRSYDAVTFDEPDTHQFHTPQIEKGSNRFGRRLDRLTAADLEEDQLVRFQLPRTKIEITGRIVALEGQRVRLDGRDLFVDNEKVEDTYRRNQNAREFYPELIVPEGCVFVLNDERWRHGADRFDSRNLGPIPVEAISHRFTPQEARPRSRRRR
ncbi:MAG: signal peptidase I [Planctomycetota bacterium]